MEEKTNTEKPVLNTNELAFERTILAENRTLMAWIRTSISMISFGFTIYKFFHEINQAASPSPHFFTPRKVGMVMIGFGLLALIWGLTEHMAVTRKLKDNYPGVQKSKSAWLAVLVLLFGLVLFFGVLFRQ